MIRATAILPLFSSRLSGGTDEEYGGRLAYGIRRCIAALVNVIAPRGCAGCDAPDEVLCPTCTVLFHGVHRRQLGVGGDGGIGYCCARYRGMARRAILLWKDHGDQECDRVFGAALARLAVRSGVASSGGRGSQALLVVPAPSSSRSMRRRGRNHMLHVAKIMARELQRVGIEAQAQSVLRIHGVSAKSVETGGAAGRAKRIQGHIVPVPHADCRGRKVLLIDDIVTTGATMRQCARVLRLAGACQVDCLALAGSDATV